MFRIPLVCLVLIALPVCAQSGVDQSLLASLPNVSFHGSNLVASGRLEPADIDRLQRAGIRHVIDLSDESETPDFDEAKAMKTANIGYENLPIHGADGLSAANVRAFDNLMKGLDGQPTLIHCASSNRVGALIALRAATLQGASTEEALESGKSWGLKSLLPIVEERLKEASNCNETLLASAPNASDRSACSGE